MTVSESDRAARCRAIRADTEPTPSSPGTRRRRPSSDELSEWHPSDHPPIHRGAFTHLDRPHRRGLATWSAPFADAASAVDSRVNHGVTSDAALAVLRPALTKFGFEIEASKTASGKIRRPVLFGENGRPIVAYEVDDFHPGLGILLEVEAGRGAAGTRITEISSEPVSSWMPSTSCSA